MEHDAEDLALRNGVPIQVHAYISPMPALPANVPNKPVSLDVSSVRVRDGKIVELANGADVTSLRVDHAYHQPPGTEQDVVERSLQPLVKACVEGVNTALFAVGSLRSSKSDLLFRKMDQQGLIAAIFQSLISTLNEKASKLDAESGTSVKPRYSFSVQSSFVEIYEETILDLLAAQSSSSKSPQLTIVDGDTSFKQLQGVAMSPVTRTFEAIRPLIEAARQARCHESGLYGHAAEFSSAIVRIHVHQVFEFRDEPTKQLVSILDIVDLPPTDRLSNPGAAVRLSEGPLLNKSLFAFLDCITALAESRTVPLPPRQPPFDESLLTQLLQDALGGNCLSIALLFLTPSDSNASRATLQLGDQLQCIKTLPVVNNDIVRGLHRKYFRHLHLVKHTSDTAHVMTLSGEAARGGVQQGFVSKIHELEGRLAQETLEKRLLKEDKDKVMSVMNELKVKYHQLFNNELDIRKELLSCEQEKLALSKAFVDFQMEKNAQIQDLDNEKFEIENKLIQAEEMVVQIQQDDHKKASQIQDLCQKMNEIIHEKRTLSEELTLLQKHCQGLEHKLNQESKKNQQLSLELIVLVNQRQKSVGDAEALDMRQRDMTKQLKELEVSHANLTNENNQHQSRVSKLEHEIETMRKEIARKEIDIERLELVNQRVKVDFERQHEGLLQNQESERAKAHAAALAENAALFNEKSQLQQTLERAQADLMRAEKDRDSLHADYIKKSQEYEEILVTNERLQHDLQLQLEEFRLQLSFVTSTPEVHQGMRALMHSYQSRERELRGQVALQQQRLQRMRQARSRSGSPQTDDLPDSTAPLSDSTVKADDLIERLHAAERQVVEHMTAATVASENENRLDHLVTKLAKENEELRSLLSKPTHPDRSELEATREVQALILQQLEQVRKLSRSSQPANLQLQQKTSVAPARDQDTPAQQLLATKDEQEQKYFSKQADWMQSVEQVERRCADLFTKNVMLTEENEQLRTTLKSLIARIHTRR